MKKQVFCVLATFALVLFAGAAFAQMSAERVVADVPFAFYVGNIELPAGQYEVFPQTDAPLDLVIRNLDTGKAIVSPAITRIELKESGKPELVFRKVDAKSYLSEIHTAEANGFELKGAPGKQPQVAVKAS